MRKLIAWAFMYSLDGLLADEDTEYWQFWFGLPVDPADLKQKIGVYQSAYAHIMGRAAYEGMAGALLDLVSSTEFSNGTVGLHYRRHR